VSVVERYYQGMTTRGDQPRGRLGNVLAVHLLDGDTIALNHRGSILDVFVGTPLDSAGTGRASDEDQGG